jgi:hypothetical protein
MIKYCIKYTLLAVAVLGTAASPVPSAENPEHGNKNDGQVNQQARGTADPHKAEKSKRAIPYHGTLTAKSNSSITVGQRVFQVNSETKILKYGKPASIADGEIGKEVAGQYREEEGKLIAKSIRFGPKPEKQEGEKHENSNLDTSKSPGDTKSPSKT